MITEILLQVLKTSLFSSVLIGLLLLLVPLLQKRYCAKWRYIAWIVIAARLLIPVNPSWAQAPFSIELPEQVGAVMYVPETNALAPISDWAEPEAIPATQAIATPEAIATPGVPATPTAPFSPMQVIGFVWLAGIFVFLLFQVCAYQIFLRKLKTSQTEKIPESFKHTVWQLGVDMGICKLPEPIITDAIDAPVLIGVLRPRVLFPHTKYTGEELAFILRHELVHYRRRDMWYKLVLLLSNALHWFNPLVYLMTLQAAKDIELACDDDVVRELDSDSRARYGNTILSALPRKRRLEPVFSTHFGSNVKNMKSRLNNLFDTALKRRGIAALCAVIACTIILTSFVTFGYAAAKSNSIMTSAQVPLSDIMIHANANDGTWVAASNIEGKTWQAQINDEMKWLEDTYAEHKSGFVITETLPKSETANVSRIHYLYDNSSVFRTMSKMDGGVYIVEDERPSFSGFGYANNTDMIQRTAVMVDNNDALTIELNYSLTQGKLAVWLIDPDGNIAYQGDLKAAYNGVHTVSGKEGLWSVIRICQGENDNNSMSGNKSIILRQNQQSQISTAPARLSNALQKENEIWSQPGWNIAFVTTLSGHNNITVPSIEAGRVVCIGKIELGPGISYTADLTVGSGSGAMIALSESPDITHHDHEGNEWKQYFSIDATGIQFSSERARTFYVYMGSKSIGGTELKNVRVSLAQSHSDGDPFFQIKSNGARNVNHSGGFQAQSGQTLTITVTSSFRVGTVDFFLYSPDGREQKFTFDGTNTAKTVLLSEGGWAYFCTGFFDSGDIVITGVISDAASFGAQSSRSGSSDTKRYDDEGFRIMNSSGTWGESINRLLPNMSPAGVDRVVSIYLDRQLFPGISTSISARTVASRIETAMEYMTEEGRSAAHERLDAYLAIPDNRQNISDNSGYTQPYAYNVIGVYNGGYDEHPSTLSKSEADRRAADIIQRTGNWSYVEPYLPYLTDEGIRNVVDIFNSKNTNANHKRASDYMNR